MLSLHQPEFESVVVLTPEPTALTDAYGLIKLLRRQVGIKRASVIVNQVTDGREGTQTFQKLKDVAAKFVDVQLEYLGHWQRDEKITTGVIKRKILLDLDAGSFVGSVVCNFWPSVFRLNLRVRDDDTSLSTSPEARASEWFRQSSKSAEDRSV